MNTAMEVAGTQVQINSFTVCQQQGEIRENSEFCGGKNPCREKSLNFEKMGKIREFYKNMSVKYQGIFNMFHNNKKNHRNDVGICMIKTI